MTVFRRMACWTVCWTMLLALAPGVGAMTIKTVDATGQGKTRREAITNALLEAIQQVNGAQLAADSVLKRKYKDREVDIRTNTEKILERHHDSTEELAENIKTASAGFIDGYKVLEAPKQVDGIWETRLQVRVIAIDKTSGRMFRKTIAVLPFRMPTGAETDGKRINELLTQQIVTNLVQSRRFTVLDREFLKEIGAEQKFIKSANMPVVEQAKLGQMLGADFLVVGRVDRFELTAEEKLVKVSGYRYTERTGAMDVAFRIVDVATGKIHWAGNAGVDLDYESVKNQFGLNADAGDIARFCIKAVSAAISTEVLDCIYPVKVVKAYGSGKVILNQGGNRVAVGEELHIYAVGEALIDPDTGENLGAEEELVARIVVERTTSKVSYGKVVHGQADAIARSAVCRRPKKK